MQEQDGRDQPARQLHRAAPNYRQNNILPGRHSAKGTLPSRSTLITRKRTNQPAWVAQVIKVKQM